MSLIAIHRALILSFVAVALLFGTRSLWRYGDSGSALDLVGGVAAVIVAVSGIVYLVKAPHLKRK